VTGNQISLLTVLDFVVLVVKLFFNHLMTKIKNRICIHNNLSNVVLMILSLHIAFSVVVLLLLIVNLKFFSLFCNSSKP
jgi:hypothetical protein